MGLHEACADAALPYHTVARWVKAFREGRDVVQDNPVWRTTQFNSLLPCWMLIANGLRLHRPCWTGTKGKMKTFLNESSLWTKPGLAHTNQPNLKRQSNEWKHPGSSRLKKVCPTQSAVKESHCCCCQGPLAPLAMGNSGTSTILTQYESMRLRPFTKVKEPLRGTRYNTRDEFIPVIGGQYETSTKMDALMVYDAFQTFGKSWLFNDAVSTTRLFSVDEIGDSEMVFGDMRPRIRHRLPGIHLTVGENLGKKPIRPAGKRLNRLSHACDPLKMEEQLEEEQFGFRKGKDKRDAIGLLQTISERYL
ncbi:hypothetical protein ANN_21526 [Periplaneta americana]|uniref:Uncharacterized protein n=1 Tax=Periplaneta americana TaxID=6978 RepID=A0ABQ8SGN9_PERAM|nr:hypothetical protein ANN_21526 [Periplaneta americana]